MRTKIQDVAQSPIPEKRYGYYRRCQQFRRNGEQCKAPAMKGEPLCYKHEQQADAEQRRAAMRTQFTLPPLTDAKTVQRALSDVAKAIIGNQIDEDYAEVAQSEIGDRE